MRWAAATGHGDVGELEGATAALTSAATASPPSASPRHRRHVRFVANALTLTASLAGTDHPILYGIASPHTSDNSEF